MKPNFAEIRSKLRFVRHGADEDLDLSVFPDFLIVGPQRTGSTWLHENLIEHPQVFMPSQKEIYYFNNLRGTQYHPPELPPVQAELSWYLAHFRPDAEFLAKRNEECGQRFGEPYRIAVRGEGTATYAVALANDPELMRELFVLNPDIKIMTMVRNPIDRAWSHAKKDLATRRKRAVSEVADAEWIEFLEHPYQVACGNHLAFKQKWLKVIPPNQFFVGRFVDLVQAPERVLLDAFRFLGIDADRRYVGGVATRRVNPTESADMPQRIQERLQEIYREQVQELRDLGLID